MNYTINQSGNACTVVVNGDLKASEQGAFKALMEEIETANAGSFRIDLSQVSHIDSTGLGLLLMFNDMAKKKSASVSLVNPTVSARHAFELAHFGELFTLE